MAGKAPGVSHVSKSSGFKQVNTNSPGVMGVIVQSERGIPNTPTLVTNWEQVQKEFGGLVSGSYGMYFLKFIMEFYGADQVYVSRVIPPGLEAATITITTDVLKFALTSPGEDGEDFSLVVTKHPVKANNYSVSLRAPVNGVTQELWFAENLSDKTTDGNYWVDYIVNECKWLSLSGTDSSTDSTLSTAMGSDTTKTFSAAALSGTPSTYVPEDKDVIGSSSSNTGIYAFNEVPSVRVLAIPDDVITKNSEAAAAHLAVVTAAIAWCELKGYVIYVTSIPDNKTPAEAKTYAIDTLGIDSANTVVYYNWTKITDPLTGVPLYIPPVAMGLAAWVKTDNGADGVAKAPANVTCNGVLALRNEYITETERALLNDSGINPHIKLNGTYKTFGARMCCTDSDWTYIHVRRIYIMHWTSIVDSSWWAIFEVNDGRTIGSLRRMITSYFRGHDRSINIQGTLYNKDDPTAEPYYVNVSDGDTGEVIIDWGIIPVDTIEFLQYRTSLWDGKTETIRVVS